MLHLGQKLGWVFENRTLKKLIYFEEKINFLASDPSQKQIFQHF